MRYLLLLALVVSLVGIVMVPDAYSATNPYNNIEISLVDFKIENIDAIQNAIIIKTLVTNNGNTIFEQDYSYIFLVDDLGRTYSPSQETKDWLDQTCDNFFRFDVAPGIPEQVMICYEIPKDSKNLQLLFQDWQLPDNRGFGCEWPFECHSYPPIYLTPPTSAPTPPTPEPEVKGGNEVVVTNAPGSSTPGCEETNNCFIPSTVTINVGDSVTWDNYDAAAHTATAGSASDGPSGVWDSSLIMTGGSYSHIFDSEGVFPYFCMVHPWMMGTVIVGDVGTAPTPVPTPVPTPPTPELSTGCGEGTVLVDGVCRLAETSVTEDDMVTNTGYVVLGLFILLGIPIIIIGVIVILIRGRKKTPKLTKQERDDYEDVKEIKRKIKDGLKTPKPVKKEPAEKKETSAFCENCGNTLNPKAKFCGSCGTRIA